jgi:hypothetical protein
MPTRLALLNRFLAGWTAYFALAETPSVFDEFDQWSCPHTWCNSNG